MGNDGFGELRRDTLRALLLCVPVLSAVAGPAQAQPLRVSGVTGYLAEWELSGSVTETASGRGREFAGALTAKHVGLCSVNGPEEKPAPITLQITKSGAFSQIKATMVMDGKQCTFSGRLSDTYTGLMDCADAKGVPLTLTVK
jgi:hypothetical protein